MTVRWQQRIVDEKASSVTWRSLPGGPIVVSLEISLLFLSSPPAGLIRRYGLAEISLSTIRAELPASVEKSDSSTNVAYRSVAARVSTPDCRSSRRPGENRYCAAHIA